ncbi:hypothetical protein [Streptomyces sp. NPDC004658]|uniref:hypothetical protein n=1 Tax=Streptomyces sp. NPDC004658 TaxID=3154672 RepID=UPI00339FBB65
MHLVHTAGGPHEALTETAARLRTTEDEITILVSAGFGDPEALCARLQPVLTKPSPPTGRLIRLVMSGGAAESADRPAAARLLSDAMGTDVLAPLGAALVTPGGTLFAPSLPGRHGGWRRFSPGREPVSVGSRHPAPQWQPAVERVVPSVAGGFVVEQVPAGLLILPAGTPPEGVEALRYAVPPQAEQPLLLVGAAHTRPVPAQAVADVLAALPATVRESVLLVSADGSDLLPVGRQVAYLLGVPVEVGSGLPLLVSDPARPAPTGPLTPRTMLIDGAGEPTWRPYIEKVVCEPEGATGGAVRLGTWRPPVSGLRPALEPGAMLLDRRWQVVVTRSGLWIGPNGSAPPAETVTRPIMPDVMAVEIGLPDQALPDTVWEPLERLFSALQDDVRDRTQIRLHGEAGDEVLNGMRRLAVRHGLALAPRGWQDTGPSSSSVLAETVSAQAAALAVASSSPASVPPGEDQRATAAPAAPVPDVSGPNATAPAPSAPQVVETAPDADVVGESPVEPVLPAAEPAIGPTAEAPAGAVPAQSSSGHMENGPEAVAGPSPHQARDESAAARRPVATAARASEAVAITFTPPVTTPGSSVASLTGAEPSAPGPAS